MALGLRPLEIVAKGTYPLLVKADHWERVTLSDVANVQNGSAFESSYFDPDKGVPLIRIRDISKEETEHRYWGEFDDQYLVKTDEILIGMDGDFAASRWAGEKALLNQRVCKVMLTSDLFDEGFLYLCLQPFLNAINAETSSVTVKHLSSKTVEEIPLPLPPLIEQRRIVAKIEELFSELDKGIESLKAARAKLNVYRQAVLKQAFEGKLTAQWREENKDKLETPEQLLARIKQEREARYEKQLQEWKAAVKKWEEGGKSGKKPARSRMPKPVSTMAEAEIAHLESLPCGWLWLTAESVGIVQLGRQRSPKNRSKDYPTKYIRAANITEQGLDLGDVLDMDFLPHELSAYRLEKGDLVLSEASGSAAQVGKPAIWDNQIPNCCFQNTVIRHQPYCRDYAAYLLWLYRFFYVSGKFAQVAGGVGINHLSAFKFAQIALPLCALAEQQEIVRLLEERFAAIEQQEREINSALNQAEMLRQSILKKAFTGQLVPQDPRDEPASVLLDRIKAEREKAAQNNHSKKTRKKKTTA